MRLAICSGPRTAPKISSTNDSPIKDHFCALYWLLPVLSRTDFEYALLLGGVVVELDDFWVEGFVEVDSFRWLFDVGLGVAALG